MPGTARHRQLTEAGASAYQVVPPSLIDLTAEANLAWARRPLPADVEVDDLRALGDATLLELWVGFYVRIHEAWSPVGDPDVVREVFAPMIDEGLDRGRSVLVRRAGMPSAHGFVFAAGAGWLVCCEAVDPRGAEAREDVGTCLRAVAAGLMESGGRELLVDGHESDPHLYPVLRTVPHVTGPGLHLLRLP